MQRLGLSIAVSAVLCLVACGGGGGSNAGGITGGGGGANSTGTVTSVTVTCNPNLIVSAFNTVCSATVTGTGTIASTVLWSASAGTISPTGTFTAPSVTATTQVTITATSTFDSTKSGTAIVTVGGSTITGIQISCSPNIISTGQQSQCTAAVNGPVPEDQSVTWSASLNYLTQENCNCISPAGLVTGPTVGGMGTVYIHAVSVVDPTKAADTSLPVYSPGTVISVTPSCTKATLNPGQDTLCTAVVTGTGGYSSAVRWSASIGSMSPSGLYTASKSNTNYVETIYAWSIQGTEFGTVNVTVTPSTTTPDNVAPVVVDGGPTPTTSPYINGAFTSVTVCAPGTSNCQTIDHVLVDTGSVGLRLLAAGAAGGQLNIPLPAYTDQNTGYALVECAPFVSGYLWGPVANADIYTLGYDSGEQAPNVRMQIIGQPGQPPAPSTCSSSGVDLSNLQALGANGILGIGVFSEDCGLWCYGDWGNPYIYYSCSSSSCSSTAAFDFEQVGNPVSYFLSDSYASLLQLPIPTGLGPLQGSLIFGMNTQPNNQLGTATQIQADNSGGVMTFYLNATYPGSFLDSGSNGLFFLNSQTLGSQMPTCTGKHGWYCPLTTQSFSIINRGTSGGVAGSGPPAPATFSVVNADQLFQNSGTYAIPTLGGNWPLTPLVFDFGLPFFYGRSVFTTVGGWITAGGFAY